MPDEVERKFLIPSGVEALLAAAGDPVSIRQGYLSADGGPNWVRIRAVDSAFELCVKAWKDRSRYLRTEVTVPIPADAFAELWELTRGARLEKKRYRLPLDGGLVAEIDVYGGHVAPLVVAEVEFPDPDSCQRFEPPAGFGPDVTRDSRYGNRSLATHGYPG